MNELEPLKPLRRRVMLIVWVAVALAMTAGATWIGWSHTGSDKAQLAGWIEGVSTAVAVIVASAAAVFAYYAYQIEEQRETMRLDTIRREQASLVAAWWGAETQEMKILGTSSIRSRAWGTFTNQGAYFRNASPVPVTGVTICGFVGPELVGVINVLTGPPALEPEFLLWPEETYTFFNWLKDNQSDDVEMTMVSIYFTDAQGIRWYRSPQGDLMEISHEAEPPRQPTEADFELLRHQYTPVPGDILETPEGD